MNIIAKMQKWMDSPFGQVFMQYTYSWGAAIVILGTLFKLTHIPGANLMLFIGMGTEVFVFFISGFEKTYTKVPSSEGGAAGGTVIVGGTGAQAESAEGAEATPAGGTVVIGGGAPVGGTVIMGGGAPMNPEQLAQGASLSAAAANLAAAGQAATQAQLALSQLQNGQGGSINPDSIKATDPAAIEEAVRNYAEELKELTEVLERVKVQAARMSTDSEEMENLNRTLTGIATVYELQLRNISKQVNTIEQIDEQTRRMADQITELNNVYGRMIGALTINMGGASAKSAEKKDE
ncbi:MAG: gliding motility protein GldL [Bacteroidaceae bacterium]|nr:gliding motility protein GldL [Bacteroidaceae bacterium]